MSIRFDERVVIVTGAGNGLGHCYAREFARRGARVVVNDLGGGLAGGGADGAVAQAVVDEIVAAGGTAVASTDSVEAGDRIAQTALDAYGRIDALVNNAGILRDRTILTMTDQDWDDVYRVHLFGTYSVTRAVWEPMCSAGGGRIVMTSSIAGLYGNFGQANYAAAKLGIHGLAQTLAIEGERRGIRCNTIAPTAGSRLTATVMTPAMVEAIKPDYVAPLVMALAHDVCPANGSLFEVGGGWVMQNRWEQSEGVFFEDRYTPETLLDRWEDVTNFASSRHPARIRDCRTGLEERLGSGLELMRQGPGASRGNPAGAPVEPDVKAP